MHVHWLVTVGKKIASGYIKKKQRVVPHFSVRNVPQISNTRLFIRSSGAEVQIYIGGGG